MIFIALAIAVVLGQAYYYLTAGGLFGKKVIKILYLAVCIGSVVILVVASLPDTIFAKIMQTLLFWR